MTTVGQVEQAPDLRTAATAGTDPKPGVTSFHFVHCPFKESTAQHRQKKSVSR